MLAAPRNLGYEKTRQRGSHVRITTRTGGARHKVIRLHNPIRTKTLPGIL